MAEKPEDFRINDRVRHRNIGAGTVIWVDAHAVTVRFPGRGAAYKYDRDWFKLHPTLLTVEPRVAA